MTYECRSVAYTGQTTAVVGTGQTTATTNTRNVFCDRMAGVLHAHVVILLTARTHAQQSWAAFIRTVTVVVGCLMCLGRSVSLTECAYLKNGCSPPHPGHTGKCEPHTPWYLKTVLFGNRCSVSIGVEMSQVGVVFQSVTGNRNMCGAV